MPTTTKQTQISGNKKEPKGSFFKNEYLFLNINLQQLPLSYLNGYGLACRFRGL